MNKYSIFFLYNHYTRFAQLILYSCPKGRETLANNFIFLFSVGRGNCREHTDVCNARCFLSLVVSFHLCFSIEMFLKVHPPLSYRVKVWFVTVVVKK